MTDMATRPCWQWSGEVTGWLASPVTSSRCTSPGCGGGCTSVLYVATNKPVQLRFRTLRLYAGEYVELHDGATASDRLIGRFTSSHRPSRVIHIAGNEIFVAFRSRVVLRVNVAFNFTFQPKGMSDVIVFVPDDL